MGWLTKTDKNTASVFRVFDLLHIHIKPYESKLSTALSECKAVARCATRKTDTAINRIKTVGLKLWLLLRNMDTAIMLNFTRDCQILDGYVAYMSIWYKVHYFQE